MTTGGKSADVFGTFLETVAPLTQSPRRDRNRGLALEDVLKTLRTRTDTPAYKADFESKSVERWLAEPEADELSVLSAALRAFADPVAFVDLAIHLKWGPKKLIDALRDAEYAGLVKVDHKDDARRVSITSSGKKLLEAAT